jgi:hypothetical protein
LIGAICERGLERKMKRLLFAAAALVALSIAPHARDDRMPAKFLSSWSLREF